MTNPSLPPEPHPSIREEIASSASHGLGLVAALVAGPLLIVRAIHHEKPWGMFSASVYTITIVTLYMTSTVYHALPQGAAKRIFRRLKHCAIFLLIAGTYTPVTLVAMRGEWGRTIFTIVWALAGVGILLKATATTRHRWLPAVLYLALSWTILIAIGPLTRQVPYEGLMWLLAGGIAYTSGLAFFAAKNVPYCHFVWHLFVLAGTICHFVAMWQFIL